MGGLRWSELCPTSRAADAKWQLIKSGLWFPVTPSLSCVLIFPKSLPCSDTGLPPQTFFYALEHTAKSSLLTLFSV